MKYCLVQSSVNHPAAFVFAWPLIRLCMERLVWLLGRLRYTHTPARTIASTMISWYDHSGRTQPYDFKLLALDAVYENVGAENRADFGRM